MIISRISWNTLTNVSPTNSFKYVISMYFFTPNLPDVVLFSPKYWVKYFFFCLKEGITIMVCGKSLAVLTFKYVWSWTCLIKVLIFLSEVILNVIISVNYCCISISKMSITDCNDYYYNKTLNIAYMWLCLRNRQNN